MVQEIHAKRYQISYLESTVKHAYQIQVILMKKNNVGKVTSHYSIQKWHFFPFTSTLELNKL